MAGGFSLTIEDRATTPLLRLPGVIQRSDVRKVMGRGIAGRLRRHFTKLDRERPNKLGGTRTHFFGQVRRGVQQPLLVGGDGVKVSINHVGLAQRCFGGEIRPVAAGALTLPRHPAAYGHRAREFNDLHAVWFGDGSGVLVKDGTESKDDLGEVYFRLVKKVDQKPDPSVMPTDRELQVEAVAAGDAHVKTLIDRNGLGSV